MTNPEPLIIGPLGLAIRNWETTEGTEENLKLTAKEQSSEGDETIVHRGSHVMVSEAQ